MPNWCKNEVIVSGEEDVVSEFKNLMTSNGQDFEKGFSFNKIVPQPDNILLDSLKVYNWNIENWDTKWDASSVSVYFDEEDYMEFSFLTAWSPPINVINKLKEMFPNLNIYGGYIGEGWEFAGTFED